ncbi:hypothetical protein VOLCADRAFT_109017 [Volvox carteri f. nagariensis]|uniref:tRNA (adenine(58)-N(1))-methyltransferase n=1 Tax=Volvox carteri f. nagariensis TaxID=3068 RepID=D8TRN4_VOLCA|nr:uncharacterized protein VOLCADRAFT_109017 [Volvox carteri f. nagariensis]EFJ49926.1 hypothetical protein VOLCADRAFT_109017 [Volvox carteri f. nagariensis]|eukprot:XP_002948991.1 hypothetical protein VOLCADRAFT_109017 [Volvox carteri f. nagariensis]
MNFLASTSCTGDGLSTSSSSIKEGDCVIVYEGMNSMKAVYVSTKGRYDNRFGTFKHESWIGKPFGSKVTSSNKGASGWVLLLRPTPELWTQVLRHRTQILYLADISMVVTHLDLKPGSVVLESGTGSGSLTHSLVRAVAPTGHVHTFEFHAGRAEDAAAEFKQHGLSGLVTVTQRNIEELGFPDTLHGAADGVFLDLPAPHKVVPSAAACLRPNGRFCAFSPCIEQVQRTAEALSSSGFTDLITYECLLRECEDVGGVAGGKTGEKAGAVGTSAETACGQEANEPPQGQGQGAAPGCALAAAGDAAVGRSRVVSWRPSAEARGHTGYLIFARKFVCG